MLEQTLNSDFDILTKFKDFSYDDNKLLIFN